MYCKQIHEFRSLAQFDGRIFFLNERIKKGSRGKAEGKGREEKEREREKRKE